MKITEYISLTIDRFSWGYVFTYTDLTTEVSQREAVIKALNRMVSSGKIAKLSKGKYYKPENSPFGNLQLLNTYDEKEGILNIDLNAFDRLSQ